MQNLRARAKQLAANDFLRHNAVFFVGSLFVAFLNYLYYPVLGRLMSLDEFGELQVIVSLFTQMVIFITVVTLVSTNIISNVEDKDEVNQTVSELEKVTQYAAIGVLVLLTLAAPWLAATLKFESPLPFVVLGLILVTGVSAGFRGAYLRGKSDFLNAAVVGSIVAGFKIVASAGFVVVGFSTAGAAGGILAAQIFGLAFATQKARKLGYVNIKGNLHPNWKLLRPQARYAGLVLFVSLITTIMWSADVTIVKYLFSPEVAGMYSGVATVSRIIFFLTGSITVVLLTVVKRSQPPEQNSKLLIRSLALTLVMGGSATLVFVLFPTQIVHLFFGTRYDAFAHLLPLLSIAMLAVSLGTLFSNYHIALRHYWVMLYVGAGAVVTTVALILSHKTPDDVVRGIAIGSISMFVGLLLWTGYRAGFIDLKKQK